MSPRQKRRAPPARRAADSARAVPLASKVLDTVDSRPGSALAHEMAVDGLRTKNAHPLLMESMGCALARYANPSNRLDALLVNSAAGAATELASGMHPPARRRRAGESAAADSAHASLRSSATSVLEGEAEEPWWASNASVDVVSRGADASAHAVADAPTSVEAARGARSCQCLPLRSRAVTARAALRPPRHRKAALRRGRRDDEDWMMITRARAARPRTPSLGLPLPPPPMHDLPRPSGAEPSSESGGLVAATMLRPSDGPARGRPRVAGGRAARRRPAAAGALQT